MGRILRGGFGVLRDRPGAVLLWALIYGAALAALAFSIRWGAQLQPEIGADPAASASLSGINLLFNLVFLILFVVLLTAAMRSVFRPAEPGIAFLRFGMDELRQIGLALFFLILFYVGAIIVGIVIGVIGILFMAAAGVGTGMMVVMGVGIAALLILGCWLAVRLSLSFPLTLLRGRITISESWRLTRRRFWPLFGAYLLIYLPLLAVAIGVASVTLSDTIAEFARGGFNLQSLQAASRSQLARQLGPIDAMMILGWILSGLAGALGIALEGGALATAARELADVRAEMAETFA